MDRGDRENKEPEKLAETVCCEAAAGDLHDVLGSHQLSIDSALAFQNMQELLQPDRYYIL